MKGLRQYGKNFFRIRKELLPNKETSELVEFYYLWKKTPNGRPRRRLTKPTGGKKNSANSNSNTSQTTPTPTPTPTPTNQNNNNKKSSNNEQFSGGSEMDSDNNESDESSEQKQPASNIPSCTNCFTTSSKDWQNGGRENKQLCYDCRMYYKKYGELPKIQTQNDKKPNGTVVEITPHEANNNNNNNSIQKQSAEAKEEPIEEESVPSENESDYQDYDQDVTDTNIEMNNEAPKAEPNDKPASSPKSETQNETISSSNTLTTSLNNDVNMKEEIDEVKPSEPAEENTKTFKPIKSSNNFYSINSFINQQQQQENAKETDVNKEVEEATSNSKKDKKECANPRPVSACSSACSPVPLLSPQKSNQFLV